MRCASYLHSTFVMSSNWLAQQTTGRRHRSYSGYAKLLSTVILFALVVIFLRISNSGADTSPSSPTTTSRCSSGARSHSCCSDTKECEIVAPYIFDSLYSLLKQWPSTYGSNGHTIIPVTLLPNVPLYHAKRQGGRPSKATWFAFDAQVLLQTKLSSLLIFNLVKCPWEYLRHRAQHCSIHLYQRSR